MRTPNPDSEDSFNDALLKALVSEKEKHRAAKLALEAAHAEITFLSKENKTLKVSKTLLETVVKENDAQPFVIEEPAEDPVQPSILYDALAQQREIYETQGYPEIQDEIRDEIYPEEIKKDAHLFDLSQVSSTSRESPIFRHFLDNDTDTIVQDNSPQSPPNLQTIQEADEQTIQEIDERRASLIEISPPSQQVRPCPHSRLPFQLLTIYFLASSQS